ncbi:MAG: hypothetical protein AB8H47_20035 [Bacteroidia bacterium]
MRTFIALSVLAASLLMACGSSEKSRYLNQYSSFMSEVKTDYARFDNDDWEDHNEQLQQFLREDFQEIKDDLDDEEKAHLISEAFSYYVYQYGENGLAHFQENEEIYMDMVQESADLAVELAEIFSKDVVPELQKHMPEIRRIGESFLRDLEDKGTIDRLEETLERFGERMEEIGEELEDEMEERAEEIEKDAERWERDQERQRDRDREKAKKKRSEQWEL